MSNDIVSEPAVKYQKATEGISKSEFLAIAASTGLNLTEFSALLPVSKRTIEKAKDQDLLSPLVSDRAMQLASLYEQGAMVFESSERFQKWLKSSLIAFGGKMPLDFMNNDTGISMVRDLLGRIEYGVYS